MTRLMIGRSIGISWHTWYATTITVHSVAKDIRREQEARWIVYQLEDVEAHLDD